MILTNEERALLLKQYKVDILFECPFTKEIAGMDPEQFVKEILLGQMNVGYIAVGSDFRLDMIGREIFTCWTGFRENIILGFWFSRKSSMREGTSAVHTSGRYCEGDRWSWQRSFLAILIL